MKLPTIQDWLWIEVMFIQAMIGAISSNFRQIVLSYENSKWNLIVTLEKDIDEDREEVADIIEEFSIFLEDIKGKISDIAYANASADIEVSGGELDVVIKENERVIFRRKEVGG